jgi:PKD repeat protein
MSRKWLVVLLAFIAGLSFTPRELNASRFKMGISNDGFGRVSSATVDNEGGASFLYNENGSLKRVALAGVGDIPNESSVSFSGKNINFKNFLIGGISKPKSVLVNNPGMEFVSISDVTVTGEFNVSHNCGPILDAGSQCGIDVTFSPTSIGEKTGTLTITSSAAGSPHTIDLYGIGGTGEAPPVADFLADTQNICLGNTVAFSDATANNPTSWSWSFPGGTPSSSTQQNPTITYDTPGVFNVQLTTSNPYGSDDLVKNGFVTVSNGQTTQSTGSVEWAKITNSPSGNTMASDPNGLSYIFGKFVGSTTVGPLTLSGTSGYEYGYIAKLKSNGDVANAKMVIRNPYPSVSNFEIEGIAADASGNFYLTGYFSSNRYPTESQRPIYFGNIPLNTDREHRRDVFLAKYSASGACLWAVSASGEMNDYGVAISIDDNGGLYLAGSFYGDYYSTGIRTSINFGSYTLYSTSNYANTFIVKYNASNGNALWAKQLESNDFSDNETFCRDVKTDQSGSVYVAGSFQGQAWFPSLQQSNGLQDGYIAKYAGNGSLEWVRKFGGNNTEIFNTPWYYDEINSLEIDRDGNIYITGSFSETANFGNQTLTSFGKKDIFVCKINSAGSVQWAVRAGGSGPDVGDSISVDQAGGVYVMGSFSGEAPTFENTKLSISAGKFIAKYDGNGNLIWVRELDGVSVFDSTDIASNPAGSVLASHSKSSDGTYIGEIVEVAICDELTPVVTVNGPDNLCQGDVVTLSAPSGYSSYSWSNGASTASIQITESGTYSVEVADCFSGCTGVSEPVEISFDSLPFVDLGNDIDIFLEDIVTLDAGAGFSSYLWSNGATSRSLSLSGSDLGVGEHVFFVTAANAGGCTNMDSVIVTVHSLPDLIVHDQTLQPTAVLQGGTTTLSYTLSNVGVSASAATSVRYYLSSDTAYHSADSYLGSDTVAALNGGQSLLMTQEIDLPATAGVGDWYVLAQVDPDNAVSEKNENNNLFYTQISIVPPQAALAVSPLSVEIPAGSGTRSFSVSNSGAGDMNWTATESTGWIAIASGGSGVNSGTITVNFSENNGSERSGEIVVEAPGATNSPVVLLVVQSDSQIQPGDVDGNGILDLSDAIAALRILAGVATPISVGGDVNGDGKIGIEEIIFILRSISQPDFSLNSNSAQLDSSAQIGTLGVSAPAGYNWNATSDVSWVTISAGSSGAGNGSIEYSVSANISLNLRTGTISVEGHTFTITQSGLNCSYSISPSNQNFGADGGNGTISVSATSGCDWNATENANWIVITSGTSGTGNGTVEFSVTSNSGMDERSANLTIAGKTFSVSQTSGAIVIPDDYPTIQQGIDAAQTGGTLLVKPGTYYENIDFQGKNLLVASLFHTTNDPAYISQTVINGNGSESVVHFVNGETRDAVLKGFTLTNGYAGGAWPDNGGGAIYINDSSPFLKNLVLSGNTATWGGAIFCINSNANPKFENTIIRDNIANDSGGGIYTAGNTNIEMENVIIASNTAAWSGGGVFMNNSSTATIQNSVISANSAAESNGVSGGGGGLSLVNASTATLLNTIVWNNTTTEQVRFWVNGDPNTLTVSYSLMEGGTNGVVTDGNGTLNWSSGNIDANPLFVNAASGDYRLQSSSPAKDAGNSVFRYNDGCLPPGLGAATNDMGAYGGALNCQWE